MKILPKIDMHVHSLPRKSPFRSCEGLVAGFTTPGELRRIYDEIHVEKGVQMPLVSSEFFTGEVSNEASMELADSHPETYDWFCNVDPRWGQNAPETPLDRYIAYYKERGAKGVGEIVANLYFDDPRVMNLFACCEKLSMPVLFHIGYPERDYGLIDELGLRRLEKVLAAFPNLTVIGHSQKFWAEIGGGLTEQERGGYPRGKVESGGRLVELMRRYPNLHGDLSASSGSNAVMRDPEFGCSFIEEFQDRLFFGTDICNPLDVRKPMLQLSGWLDTMCDQGHISQSAYEKVGRGNALRILEAR